MSGLVPPNTHPDVQAPYESTGVPFVRQSGSNPNHAGNFHRGLDDFERTQNKLLLRFMVGIKTALDLGEANVSGIVAAIILNISKLDSEDESYFNKFEPSVRRAIESGLEKMAAGDTSGALNHARFALTIEPFNIPSIPDERRALNGLAVDQGSATIEQLTEHIVWKNAREIIFMLDRAARNYDTYKHLTDFGSEKIIVETFSDQGMLGLRKLIPYGDRNIPVATRDGFPPLIRPENGSSPSI